jgi:hypothetical protein
MISIKNSPAATIRRRLSAVKAARTLPWPECRRGPLCQAEILERDLTPKQSNRHPVRSADRSADEEGADAGGHRHG